VERQTLKADGTVVKAWTPVNIKEDFARVLALATTTQPDEREMLPLLINGLVMPRPWLAKGSYPKAELPKIDETLQSLKDAVKAATPSYKSPLNKRITREFDIFNPYQHQIQTNPDGSFVDPMGGGMVPGSSMTIPAAGTPGSTVPGGTATTVPGGTAMNPDGTYRAQEVWVPEHTLIRFIDVTAKPGFTYQYRIRMRVANPNYGLKNLVVSESLAKIKELTSSWKEIPDKVTLPGETNFYTMGTKVKGVLGTDNEATAVEFHNYLDRVQLKPGRKESEFPYGEWVVAQMRAYRGEFIGRQQNHEVALWFPTRESFDFAVPPRQQRSQPAPPKGHSH
jgi:hypothetical protein